MSTELTTPAPVSVLRPQRRRTVLRAWAEVRGLLGGHTAAGRDVRLRTHDGVDLAASLLPGPAATAAAGTTGAGPAVVLLHGFAAHRRKPRYAWLADELATRLTVLTVDLRGHGQSRGTSGLGADEAADVAAAVAWLRDRGHPWVAVVGVSMGATSSANAVAAGTAPDALVLVSGPGWIELEPTTLPMQQLRRIWQAPAGPAALRAVTGVRVASHRGWRPPLDPARATDELATPLLVVHGRDDAWFPPDHATEIVTGAHDATLWLEDVFGHAEDGFVDPFGRRLATALLRAHATGTFPSRQELPW